MSRHVGDLVHVPEAKPEEGLIVWWTGVLTRGVTSNKDNGSYRRLGEKKKRIIPTGGVVGSGLAGLRPYVSVRALVDEFEEMLSREPVITSLDPIEAFPALVEFVKPALRTEDVLAA